jgi:hypothetical protein
MIIGLFDSWVNSPSGQALYQVSVRHVKSLPSASFRFHLAVDTLAFDYRIPIITAPSGLSPFGNEACPAHQPESKLRLCIVRVIIHLLFKKLILQIEV